MYVLFDIVQNHLWGLRVTFKNMIIYYTYNDSKILVKN